MICTALFARARIAREQADDDFAEALLQESLTLAHHQGLAYSLANTHFERAMLALTRDNVAQASWEIQQSLSAFRVLENPWFVGVALLGAGLTELLSGDRMAAARDYAESITLLGAWRENTPARAAGLLAGLVGLLCASDLGSARQAEQAAQLWALVAASEPQIGRRVTPPFLHLPQPSKAHSRACELLDPGSLGACFSAGSVSNPSAFVCMTLRGEITAAALPSVHVQRDHALLREHSRK